jgi:D-alanyl-D-alanine carboxypeptidase
MNPRVCLLVLPALLAGLFNPALFAAEPVSALTPPKAFDVKAIDEYLAAHVKDKPIVGLSVAIMKEGKLVFVKGFGKTSVKNGEDVGIDTMFGAGSVTKQFTCACILLLAEDGKLSIQDKVAKYYPELTRAKDITLYDLMTHASGYPDYYPLDFVDQRMEKTTAHDKLIQEYAGGKLDFEPGSRWSYSNTGFIILGRVIEKVSGEPFAKFLERRILKPLGMDHSAFEPKQGTKYLSAGHTAFALGDPEIATQEADGWIHAAGGLFTTPTDLAKWDLALMEGKVLKPESFQTMTTARKLSDGRTKAYGCGLGILERDGEKILQHSGAVSGFLAFNAMLPRTKSALILLSNCDHVDAGSLHNELLALLLKSVAGDTPLIPTIDGAPAKETALKLLHLLQSGEIERDALGEDYSKFLTPERVKAAKERLQALGEPEKIEVESTYERGGMEVALIRFTFKNVKVKAYLYRTPNGKIQEFLLYKS